VQAFIAEHVDSVMQLEVLLLLHGRPQTEFSAADIADQLRIDRGWVEGQLDNLCSRGLLACSDAPPRGYRYAPKSPESASAVAELARAYADRRVTIISMIFSKPPSSIRTFADAFRLRKDRSDG
jgi:predicted ArsR family transcriptional regulator